MKISSLVKEVFLRHSQTRKLLAKSTLLHPGETSRHAYFVESGCLRMWYNDVGKDVTIKFFTPEHVVASLESFYHEEPSLFGIESIVPTAVRVVNKEMFAKELRESPAFKDEMLSIAVSCMSDYQILFLNQILNNPEDRYRLIIKHNPQLFDFVPHHYIASYLGITPVSLSRIRKRVQGADNC